MWRYFSAHLLLLISSNNQDYDLYFTFFVRITSRKQDCVATHTPVVVLARVKYQKDQKDGMHSAAEV
jgi:hypothetical protein